MKSTTNDFEVYRDQRLSTCMDGHNGLFWVPIAVGPNETVNLKIIISDGGGWDHVSVSLPNRCPSWEEVCFVKHLFFKPDETVIQFHPKKSEYVNCFPTCLHLWRKQGEEHELPPSWMVGPKGRCAND